MTAFIGDCPFTDGSLANLAHSSAAELRIDLPTAAKLKTAVVRGLKLSSTNAKAVFEGTVEGGVSWTQLAEIAEANEYAEVALDAAAPAVTAFRIRAGGEADPKILLLQELSLFE